MAKPAKIKDVVFYWASTKTPNPMSDKYQVDLCQLRDTTIEKLEAMGVEVQNKGDDRGFFVTCKSKYPIDVFYADGKPVNTLVGNESVGDVVVTTYEWTFRKTKGTSLGVSKMIVTDLKEVEGASDIDLDDLEEL